MHTDDATRFERDISITIGKYAHEMGVVNRYAPLEFLVTPSMNEQFLFAMQDYDPRYWQETDDGLPMVHPVLLLHMSPRTRSPSWNLAPGMGSVLGRGHTHFFAPGRVGQMFRVEWEVLEVYEKRGRPYRNTETVITNRDGTLIMRRQLHSQRSRELGCHRLVGPTGGARSGVAPAWHVVSRSLSRLSSGGCHPPRMQSARHTTEGHLSLVGVMPMRSAVSILIDEHTRVLVQGITGGQARVDTERSLRYGTRIAAGVTPGRGGDRVHGVPVYHTVKQAVAHHDVDVSVIYGGPDRG